MSGFAVEATGRFGVRLLADIIRPHRFLDFLQCACRFTRRGARCAGPAYPVGQQWALLAVFLGELEFGNNAGAASVAYSRRR